MSEVHQAVETVRVEQKRLTTQFVSLAARVGQIETALRQFPELAALLPTAPPAPLPLQPAATVAPPPPSGGIPNISGALHAIMENLSGLAQALQAQAPQAAPAAASGAPLSAADAALFNPGGAAVVAFTQTDRDVPPVSAGK